MGKYFVALLYMLMINDFLPTLSRNINESLMIKNISRHLLPHRQHTCNFYAISHTKGCCSESCSTLQKNKNSHDLAKTKS